MKIAEASTFGILLRDKFAQLEEDALEEDHDGANEVLERLRLDALQSVLASVGGPLQRQGHQAYGAPIALPVATALQQLDVRY